MKAGLIIILFVFIATSSGFADNIDRRDAYNARNLYTSGTDFYDQKDYKTAISKLDEAYQLNPRDIKTRINLIKSYIGQAIKEKKAGQYDRATELLLNALDIEDDIPEIRVLLASTYFDQGDLTSAKGELRIAYLLSPDNPSITSFLGEIYFQEGYLQKALYFWNQAYQQEPYNDNLVKKIDRVKREYETQKNFKHIRSHPFLLKYDPQYSQLAERSLTILMSAYSTVGKQLNYFPLSEVIIIIYDHDDFFEATGTDGLIAGMYDGKIRIKASPKLDNEAYLEEIIFHEYTHVLIRFISKDNCPFWLNEGLAQILSHRNARVDLENLTNLELESDFFRLQNLDTFLGLRKSIEYDINLSETIKLAYLKSLLTTQYVIAQYGLGACIDMLHDLKTEKIQDIVKSRIGISLDELDIRIQQNIASAKDKLSDQLQKEADTNESDND